MPSRFIGPILQHLRHERYRPSIRREIASEMQVDSEDREAFDAALDELLDSGRLELGDDEKIRLPRMPEEVTGTIRLHPRGFAFVMTDQPYRDGDLFVPRGSVRDAISGDRVRVQVLRQPWRSKGKPERSDATGRVLEVLERGQEAFVGTLLRKRGSWMVEPDGRSLHEPVIIRDPHAKNAKEGDKVVIELLHYPDEEYHAEGVITKVLGEAGQPDIETQAVIEAHGLRTEFPPEAMQEASGAARKFDNELESELEQREDLRDRFIFTIDPPDARDFDDAISLERTKEGGWILGVHIADVAHFVRSGGGLDEEAKARGNSVYLPRLVIPMLPETLSNGVCSLQEGVPRFTKSVFIEFDKRGKVMGQRVSGTVIQSKKRLTYLEAQALIDGDIKAARQHARTEPVYEDTLIDLLREANSLAQTLRKRRLRDGMIVLNLPEVELVFDEDGHVVDAVPEDDAFTHTVIEMFMVEANEALARLFDGLHVPILRRTHPDPSFGDLEDLRLFARAAHFNLPDNVTRHDIQALLQATHETPASRAVSFAVLRTLTKAEYSPALIGHFALASEHYAHFTSPIRRYPDLLLHRALEAYLAATDNGANPPGGRKRQSMGRSLRQDARVPDEGQLIELGRHCSDTEREAEAAERELRDFLVMQFLHEHHLGSEFPGVVTGVARHGVFISIEQFLVEGRVALSDLPGKDKGGTERWEVDEARGRLVAPRAGAMISVGDILTVQIAGVDLATRHLDLLITKLAARDEDEVARAAQQAGKKGRGDRRKDGRGKGKGRSAAGGKRSGDKRGRRSRRR